MPPITTTRQRSELFDVYVGTETASLGTTETFRASRTVSDQSIQKTVSEGHKYNKRANERLRRRIIEAYGYEPKPLGDMGGPFVTQKVRTYSFPRETFDLFGGNPAGPNWAYKGQAAAWSATGGLSVANFIQPSTNAQMDAYGTIAIARCIPTNPLAGMGQFLAELRDFPKPPKIQEWRNIVKGARGGLKRQGRQTAKTAAGEYLNAVFGWAPMISDLKDLSKVVQNAEPIMRKYYNEANRPIHRSYYFPDEITSTNTVVSQAIPPDPPLNPYLWTKSGVLTKSDRTVTKRYFKGCFQYYLPKLSATDDALERLGKMNRIREAMMNKLLGLRITHDLAWKLTPWSWLIDWNSSVGSVIHNWSAFSNDGLVMQYGYIMETVERTVTYSLVGVQSSQGTHNFTRVYVYTTKSRRRATPYGFGLNPISFSGKQWAILAALGISKAPRSLSF